MTMTQVSAVAARFKADAPSPLPLGTRARILAYLSVLVLIVELGAPFRGLMDVPISFFLKNKLHLSPQAVAEFRLVMGLPIYLCFLFGFLRDTWNPFGSRDRSFLILFGAATCALYVGFAFVPVTYATLLIATTLLTTSFLFVYSAREGLASTLGRQHVMSGQVSAAWNAFISVPIVAAYFLGGQLSDRLEGRNADQAARILFLIGAAVMVIVALYGLWKPRFVFDKLRDEGGGATRRMSDLKRLARHWPLYPAMLIFFLWNFAPAQVTVLQFYLQNTLHANDAAFGNYNAIFNVSFIPPFLLYGVLCLKFPLRPLLLWGTVLGVPQMLPMLFVHSVSGAFIMAAVMGVMGGICSAAYIDLIIRSAPVGLEGTTLMMSWAAYYVANRLGDVLGTMLYDRFGGFTAPVIATTIVYALILPLLFVVPGRLTATPDGEVPQDGFG